MAFEECDGKENIASPHHESPITPNDVAPLVAKENQELFQNVAKAFCEAEHRMKKVEWIDGTDVPSINELRYVGYHLFKACQLQDQDDVFLQTEELHRAERHCKRASFDALELGMIKQFECAGDFKEEYSDFPVSDVFPEYLDKLSVLEDSKRFLSNAAGGEDRDEYYVDCEKRLDELISINTSFLAAREEINKKRSQYHTEQRRAETAETIAETAETIAETAETRAITAEKISNRNFVVAIIMAIIALGSFMIDLDLDSQSVIAEEVQKVPDQGASKSGDNPSSVP